MRPCERKMASFDAAAAPDPTSTVASLARAAADAAAELRAELDED